jgi:hypothetical protein
VEDEDGEVIKKYDIPAPDRNQSVTADPEKSKYRMDKMGKMLGLGGKDGKAEAGTATTTAAGATAGTAAKKAASNEQEDDPRLRFTLTQGGRRMSKAEFIDSIRKLDPKSRVQAVENSNAPEIVKQEARKDAREQAYAAHTQNTSASQRHRRSVPVVQEHAPADTGNPVAEIQRVHTNDSNEVRLIDSGGQAVPFHDISYDIRPRRRSEDGETAAERRRRVALHRQTADEDSDDDGTDRVPPARRPAGSPPQRNPSDGGETAAERRRREGALGLRTQDESDSEEEDGSRKESSSAQRTNIRFADQTQPGSGSASGTRETALKWGKNVGR